ncbi:hypothetical protein HDU67_006313 [Dinochytrium kinnereticum]|nr:hypothetical protein HDU67_006313 [Dinochytrium kinnereticum]
MASAAISSMASDDLDRLIRPSRPVKHSTSNNRSNPFDDPALDSIVNPFEDLLHLDDDDDHDPNPVPQSVQSRVMDELDVLAREQADSEFARKLQEDEYAVAEQERRQRLQQQQHYHHHASAVVPTMAPVAAQIPAPTFSSGTRLGVYAPTAASMRSPTISSQPINPNFTSPPIAPTTVSQFPPPAAYQPIMPGSPYGAPYTVPSTAPMYYPQPNPGGYYMPSNIGYYVPPPPFATQSPYMTHNPYQPPVIHPIVSAPPPHFSTTPASAVGQVGTRVNYQLPSGSVLPTVYSSSGVGSVTPNSAPHPYPETKVPLSTGR